MPISVAIIGAGPAGFYTAEALVDSGSAFLVDVVERLPAPFGLVRYGVAPDNHTTRKVANRFERTALHEQVRYFGNVEVGRDVGFDELRDLYDVVILALGAPLDRRLGIPGDDKAGVIGSAAFVGWYCGHPDFTNLEPDLDTRAVAVIGNGNVALDVARILVKTGAEMASTDLPDHAARVIQASPLTDVHLTGRRGPVEAKFTNVELREMGHLENCVPRVDPSQLPDGVGELPDRERRLKEKNLSTLKQFAAMSPDAGKKRVHFEFYAAPVEILGGDRVEGLRLERTRVVDGGAVGTGEFFTIACGVVIPAVGDRSNSVNGVPFDAKRGIVVNADGRVADGVYAVGWVMRGPTGVISTNRVDARCVAEHICVDFEDGRKPGRGSLEKLLRERGVRYVSYAEWQEIDEAEIANAPESAPRRKFVTVEDMLAVIEARDKQQKAV